VEVLPENMGPRINSRYPFFLDLSSNVADVDADADPGIDADSPVVSDTGNEGDTDNEVIVFVPIMSVLFILIIMLLYI
jgi:hypothetical protein